MRVVVCGGRDFTDYRYFAARLCAIRDERGGFDVIIHGGAKGADWCAHLFASSGPPNSESVYQANWALHGSRAGPMRNERMLVEGRPDLVVAFPGGRGTADCIRRARKLGIEVIEVPKKTSSNLLPPSTSNPEGK